MLSSPLAAPFLTMQNKVVVLDLENNTLSANMLRDIIGHYTTLYLFNCQGQFEYALEDLTELASWISSGQVVILETASVKTKEFEYAVVVGQLMALVEPNVHIDVISVMPSCEILTQMLSVSNLDCSLLQIQAPSVEKNPQSKIPSLETIQQKPYLQLVKRYCDALDQMTGKPNTVSSLLNSIGNILQVVPEKAQHLVGMLINLKIIKRADAQVSVRKKVLRQWTQLDLEQQRTNAKLPSMDALLQSLPTNSQITLPEPHAETSIQNIQQTLFENFDQIDPMQIKIMHKLQALKSEKPKDIYELRDLLEQLFPQADIRVLLKELVKKGYIHWNGLSVIYSHEMFLN